MAELYGISARLLKGDAQTPATSTSTLVIFGSAYSSNAKLGIPQKLYDYKEYLTTYHSGTEPEGHLLLDDSAEYALSLISGVWFVNVNKTSSTSESSSASSEYIEDALSYIVLNSSDIPNLICIPGTQDSTVLSTLVGQCKGGINGQFHAQGIVDVAQSANQIDASGNPVSAHITCPNTDGSLLSAWGNVILGESEQGEITKHIPASIVFAVKRIEQDAQNINNLPYRSIGNLRISCKGLCTKVSETLTRCTCKQSKMNEVAENGIISLVNQGNNRWFTWGDHTSVVTSGAVDDETFRFDSTVAMLYHILNRFIQKWANIIDSPMSLRLRDCILAEEQDHLNGLKALGCLVGNPQCLFRPVDNTSDSIGKGQFYFTNIATVVPPAKYVELQVQYTDSGLSAYIEQ